MRQALQESQQSLVGLYDGNPKRATLHSSTEQLLKAFCNITLYSLPNFTIFITPLSPGAKRTQIQEIGIGENDLWIAATALRHSLIIVTSDSDF